jgi:putative SOS response-associated peptidase YedK
LPHHFFLDAGAEALAAPFGLPAEGVAAWREAVPGRVVPAVAGAPRRFLPMRLGMIPMGRQTARKRPVLETIVNARAETLFAKPAFAGLARCLLPVGGWYEWTGEGRRRRQRRAVRMPGRPVIALAAVWDLWTAPGGTEVASLATVTCAPNAEVEAVHDRMPVILGEGAWPVWLGEAEGDPAALLVPAPDGSLAVEPAPER